MTTLSKPLVHSDVNYTFRTYREPLTHVPNFTLLQCELKTILFSLLI